MRATQDALHKLRALPLLVALATDAATATDPLLRLQATGTLGGATHGHVACADALLSWRVSRREGDAVVSTLIS